MWGRAVERATVAGHPCLVYSRRPRSVSDLLLTTSHTYDVPGTYFATARVEAHRDGDTTADRCRIETLGQARVVVT